MPRTVIVNNFVDENELTRFRSEYTLLNNLKHKLILHPKELREEQSFWVMEFEEFDGISLTDELLLSQLTLLEKVEISIQMVSAISWLHSNGMLHNVITPASFLYNKATDELKLYRLAKATNTDSLTQALDLGSELDFPLYCIAPEQTSRLDDAVGFYSDIYGMGAVLYKLFSGHYPFDYDDPMALIHAHLAQSPDPITPSVPAPINDIIMKCIEKNPALRYQSCSSILADLQFCRDSLIYYGEINSFSVGLLDRENQLNPTGRFWGREAERKRLAELSSQVKKNQSCELVLLKGAAGIGKTALFQAFKADISSRQPFFFEGQFASNKTSIPYFGLIGAINNLIEKILLQDDDYVQYVKSELMAGVGSNIEIIVNLVPSLRTIVGQQSPLTTLPYAESQNRFNMTFLSFFKIMSDLHDGLTLFLDNYHWADQSSTSLIKQIIDDPQIKNLMIIIAYNHEKSDVIQKALPLYEEITNKHIIELEPLSDDDAALMISDTLAMPFEASSPFILLLQEKTKGNPYSISRFINSIYAKGLLTFDRSDLTWSWDLNAIKYEMTSDNVADYLLNTLKQLPESTYLLIAKAALIGKVFTTQQLLRIFELEDTSSINQELRFAVDANLLISKRIGGGEYIEYVFAHERIQEAAAQLMTEDQSQQSHLLIGLYMLASQSEQSHPDDIIATLEHLNRSISLIREPETLYKLAQLNFIAAIHVKEAMAYSVASSYLEQARSVLADTNQAKFVALYLKVMVELTELAFLQLQFDDAEGLMKQVQLISSEPSIHIRLQQMKILALISVNRMEEGLNIGLQVLDELGIQLPEEDDPFVYYPKLDELYDVNNIAALNDLPTMTDQTSIYAIDILGSIMSAAFLVAPHLYIKICYVAVKLCIEKGNTGASSNVYAVHSLLLCGVYNRYQVGLEFAGVAQAMLKKYDASAFLAKVEMVVHACAKHWSGDVKETLEPLLKAMNGGMRYGDLEYACYSAMYYCVYAFLSGRNLDKLNQECQRHLDTCIEVGQIFQANYIKIWKKIIENLQVAKQDPLTLFSNPEEDEQFRKELEETNNLSSLYSFNIGKAILAYFYDKPELAQGYLDSARVCKVGVASLYHDREFAIYESLIAYKMVDEMTIEKVMGILRTNRDYFYELAKTSPQNNNQTSRLHDALILMLEQNPDAWEYLDQAIAEADKSGMIQLSAICNLLAAEYWQDKGKNKFSSMYAQMAQQAFEAWGSAQLANRVNEQFSLSKRGTKKSKIRDNSYDLSSVLQASHTISEERQLGTLLQKVMAIINQNSGSSKGVLLLKEGNKLTVEVEEKVDVQSVDGEALLDYPYPAGVVNYVKHTLKPLVLNSIEEQEHYSSDPYLQLIQPHSVLAMPILYKGKLLGILYQENRNIQKLYSDERMEIVKLLANQAAISIEHAQLYQQVSDHAQLLEQKVEERTADLQQANSELTATLDELKTTQNQLVLSEKMAALGQLVAGIAHEINTPLGAIKSSGSNISNSLQELLHNLPKLFPLLSKEEEQLFLRLIKMTQGSTGYISTREQRKYTREMAKVLEAAGIENARSHAGTLVQLNVHSDPESYYPLLKHAFSDFIMDTAYSLASITGNTENIINAVDRAAKIVFALKSYARSTPSESKIETDIKTSIDTVLTLYHNQIKQNVEVDSYYETMPLIPCYPEELGQVWTNIIHNALHAMNYNGKLTIKTRVEGEYAVVIIGDSGAGIPDEIQAKVFEPFFTTKQVGEGSGLGLDIVQRIIQKHHGRIELESEVGRGTQFSIYLPFGKAAV